MQRYAESLSVHNLCVGYGDVPIVDGLDLQPVASGQVVSLIGPNAAGKTTLLRALAGLQKASGSVKLGDSELLNMDLAQHARLITYMPQSLPQRVGLTVLEAVIGALRASPSGNQPQSEAEIIERALSVIERVGISALAMSGLNALSGGQRQLASLAQALVRSPRVLLLDEPISALDLHYQLRVMKLVRELAAETGMIIVMVLHDLSIAARWSDRVVVLKKGTVIADGLPAEAITADVLADVYRVAGRVEVHDRGLNIMIDDIL